MILADILKSIGVDKENIIGKDLTLDIEHASSDSRVVFDRSMYLLKSGSRYDPFDFLSAVKDKAVCFVE
jgi:hypothetical protein